MIIHPVVQMERMKEEHQASVSQLLFQGFCSKFGANLNNAQTMMLFETCLALDEQQGKSERFVAMKKDAALGSLGLQLKARSGELRSSITVTELLPLWKGIQDVGWRRALGFVLRLACLSHRPVRGEMYIADLTVHERFRGTGVGRAMLEWTLREASTRPGVRYASLHVSGSNLGAKRLYERMGFRTLEVQRSSLMTWLFDEPEWNYMIHEG
ncbi:GNAT family N-acetyltransferase [Paenibacillus illinoisensis]|uniref:GNAT family N-acetyltransferase n=1 Tax=Paenibacillus illinoisensis TaxID=59845 RepID=UPI0020416A4A|nr:N-acetyltransferase [Paenibacillus illinoisensis]MCM3203630.1 GNAT family N-acetyltransferase [Paenibacillus illinoisensis]